MGARGSDPLLDLATAIADGTLVDWKALGRSTSSRAQRGLVKRLQQIAAVAAMYRSQDDRETGSGHDPASAAMLAPRAGELEPQAVELGRWGDLHLLEEIGEGSFGIVYRAHDPRLDRPVAVKLLKRAFSTDDQLASRLLHEGRTLAHVQHPNVVTVYGAGEHDGRVGLSMEFIRGLTLEQMLASHGPFSANEARQIGYELCGALAAVHHAGLVHRDVNAKNVMREEGGRLVLMDFGAGQKLSVLDGPDAEARRRVVGTPLYLAPEVLTGKASASVRSDIYSIGVLLYHLVTNEFPVSAGSVEELLRAHAASAATPLQDRRPELQRNFIRIVERATNRNPAKRFASVGRLEAALARLHRLGGYGTRAPRLRSAEPAKRSATRPTPPRSQKGPSVAVLPFSDMSPAKDQESFCEGITEELINALTQIPGMRVAARTSAFQFKGQSRDARQIGEALNVATVLDGSVRRHGDRLRVIVELIGSADGYQLWSERFDRRLEDVFAVQDEIVAAVVSALKGRLGSHRPLVARSHSHDLDAYAAYLEGRYHWNKRTEDELKKSVACFQTAIDRDPQYAEAWAGMADAYVTLATHGALPAHDVIPLARHAVERALDIDNTLAEAYTCRACVRAVHDWSWSEAESDFRHAIDLQPSYPTAHHWYAMNLLVATGRFEEATSELRRALELDPLALAVRTSLGMKSYFAGHYDEAVEELSRTIELDDRFGMAHAFLGATYTEQARFAEASTALTTALRYSGRTPEILAALGYLHGLSGDLDAARGVLDELRQLAQQRYVSPARFAQVHAGLGERSEALDRLEAAHAERAADVAWLAVRPVFASLRQEPRFVALLQRMRG